jgi:hypothetical protein
MSIKKATLIALCGNAAMLLIFLGMEFGISFFNVFRGHFPLILGLLGYGTLVFFLFTLYRKQP